MSLRGVKIGTLLGVGMAVIIGVLITTTIYSNYLSNSAQQIIEDNTIRTFNVMTIQGDSERYFSSLDETIVIITETELAVARERSSGLLNHLKQSVQKSWENETFKEEELGHAEAILAETETVAEGYFDLKEKLILAGEDRGRTFEGGYSVESKDLSGHFDTLANNKYEMSGVLTNVIMRSDRQSQEALSLVRRSQIVSWIVVGISLVLASVMAIFVVRSTKKIFDLKNEFINIIAHDLRNPVTAIIGYLDIIMTGKNLKMADVRKQLGIIEVATHRLRNQINNLLEVGRTEAGYVKINIEPVRVAEVLESSVVRAIAFAKTKGMTIQYEKPVSDEVYVSADSHKLSDVLDNLISNAIKYNKKEGLVTITSQDKGELLTISVTDTGYGIPEDQQDKMFKKYSRLEGSSKERVGGTGLGLYTVKLNMDQMKGTIEYKTKKDEGTTFTITLNKAEQEKGP